MTEKKAIDHLRENVSQFFDHYEKKFEKSMKCKKGCSACCYTDLSIFTVEADRIKEWFNDLASEEKSRLRNLWQSPVQSGACAFLYNDECTIYDSRPIICRSHGVLVKYSLSGVDQFDICPLNETPETLSSEKDALDVDRLNTLLSLAQNSHDGTEARVSLKDLKERL